MASHENDINNDPAPDRRPAVIFVGAPIAVAVVVVAVLLLTAGEDEEEPPVPSATTIECEAAPDDGGSEECPTEVIDEPGIVTVSTSEGDFDIELAVEDSPATTTSFRTLAKSGFYDGLRFNRVVPGFVIQGGDPLQDDPQLAGSGGPGYLVEEPVPAETEYTSGVVAMAKTQAEPSGTSGSQFFVVSGGDAGLPPDYAYVGTISSGLETVQAIEALGVSDGVPPRRDITIESMSVDPAPPS